MTYVGKTPERISVSEEKSKTYVIVIIGVLLMFATGTVYTFGPVPCIILFAVLAYFFFTNRKFQPDS